MSKEIKPTGMIPTTANGEPWSEKEYFEYKNDWHSSSLSKFIDLPDMEKIPITSKSYFDTGHAFEMIVEDRATGTDKFNEAFFISELEKEPPDELSEWLREKVDLTEMYKYKKDGSLHATYKNRHAWLDECQKPENVGKRPISTTNYNNLLIMVDNFFKMEIVVYENSYRIADLLPKAKYQVPILWNDEYGNEKLALIDVLVNINGQMVLLDIKTSANEKQFKNKYKEIYWLQNCHYIEGATSVFDNVYQKMIFIVAYKAAPFYSRAYEADNEETSMLDEAYSLCCYHRKQWLKAGKPSIGWKKQAQLKVYSLDVCNYNL